MISLTSLHSLFPGLVKSACSIHYSQKLSPPHWSGASSSSTPWGPVWSPSMAAVDCATCARPHRGCASHTSSGSPGISSGHFSPPPVQGLFIFSPCLVNTPVAKESNTYPSLPHHQSRTLFPNVLYLDRQHGHQRQPGRNAASWLLLWRSRIRICIFPK